MLFSEVKPNNRLQIKCEHPDPSKRLVRGIVLAVGDESLIMVTEGGDIQEIEKDQMLHILIISLPKVLSDALQVLKNQHERIYQNEEARIKLRADLEKLKNGVHDASFLSDFNGVGATTRLTASIEPDELKFISKGLTYIFGFTPYSNDEIILEIDVRDTLEYPQFVQERDVDRILDTHAPDVIQIIKKQFSYSTNTKLIESKVMHENGDFYIVQSSYQVRIPISAELFVEMREKYDNQSGG